MAVIDRRCGFDMPFLPAAGGGGGGVRGFNNRCSSLCRKQTSERASRFLSNEIFIATNRHSVAFGTAVRPTLLGIVASEMCTVSYS